MSREWPVVVFEATAYQRCVKCGMMLTPRSGPHGTLGEPMCNGTGMGRVTKRLYKKDKRLSFGYEKATAAERQEHKDLLEQIGKAKGHAKREVPWTVEELWQSWRRPRLSKAALLKLLNGEELTPMYVAHDLLAGYEATHEQVTELASILEAARS